VQRDDLGHEVALPSEPRRLVSLVPNLTETLWWWHLADRVAGRTEWCTAPPGGFPAATTVRGTKNPDVARIVALRPDLVIANEEENRPRDVAQLREAGVSVWVTRVRTLPDAARSLTELAGVLGRPGAERDLTDAFARVEATRPRDRALRVFVPIWRGMPPEEGRTDETWMSVGPATIAADVLAAAGFAVWPDAPGERYPRVGLDDVLGADLDAVLLTDEPYAFGPTDAADLVGHRVRQVDGTGLFWWGPRTASTVADLRRLARHLRRRRGRHVAQ
jgi:ABC-type Fe3+-hydroxamate transport system substrate-binding protein